MELQMNKMFFAAAMIVASIASVAPSAAMQIATGTQHFDPHSGRIPTPAIPAACLGFFESFQSPDSSAPPGTIHTSGLANGLVVIPQTVSFAQPVRNAVAVITGWDVEFSNMDDHHFGRQIVAVGIVGATSGTQLQVCIAYGLRDFSGDFDDKFEGDIRFAVLGE
jgi:hypothetical protein